MGSALTPFPAHPTLGLTPRAISVGAAGCYPAGTGSLTHSFRVGWPPQHSHGDLGGKMVGKVAMANDSGSQCTRGILATLECGRGLRLSVTHVINYFLTISSVSAS